MGRRLVLVAAVTMLVTALASPAWAASTSSSGRARSWLSGPGHHIYRGSDGEVDVDACSSVVAPHVARCDARVRADLFGKNLRPALPGMPLAPSEVSDHSYLGNNGAYDPAYLQSAYNAPSATTGFGQTVAVVDAYDAPHLESDLAHYRSVFGLPACTTANGCFEKVDQRGGTHYPAANSSWAQETSLDVQMVSAICPNCHILLIEADSADMNDLGVAVNKAVALGANVVSNSYGTDEWSGETKSDASYYNHPGVAIVASAGDGGYGVSYPAASPDVVAVGGTSLIQSTRDGVRKAIEVAWSRGGSGCSAVEPKPPWQTDAVCANRTVTDVAAVADPRTGVWVYNSGDGGWEVVGGTSVSAPIVGALYALDGNSSSTANLSSYPYANRAALNDVTAGSNGSCGGTYLCTSGAGYDGPTGLGTPNTANAFAANGAGLATLPATPDFSVAASPASVVMKPGAALKRVVTVAPWNGFTGAVSVSTSVSPATGLTSTVSAPNMVLGSALGEVSLELVAHAGGTYKVTVRASRDVMVHTTVLTVSVSDFSMKVSPAMATVDRGKPAHYTVTLKSIGAFKSAVRLSITGLRAHSVVRYTHNPAPASGSQTIVISTSTLDARGELTLHFKGVGGSLNHSVAVHLSVR